MNPILPPNSTADRHATLIYESMDEEGKTPILAADAAALSILEDSSTAVVGSDFHALLEEPAHWKAFQLQIGRTGQAAMQTKLSAKGRTFAVTLTATRFAVHGTICVVVVIDDTATAPTQDPHTATLAAIVESSDDAIIGTTAEGIITSWNRGAQRLYGYQAEEVLGRSFALIVPQSRREQMRRILTERRHGKRIEHLETLRRRKDGSLLDVSLTISPVIDRGGRVIGASSIGRDITERKKLQKQIAEVQIREQLEIGAELHDSLGQSVTAVGMLARSLQHRLATTAPGEARTAGSIVEGIGDMETQLRSISKGLMPVVLDQQGLGAALEDLAQRSTQRYKVSCRLRCGRHLAVDDTLVATQLFRIAQEAVHNAARHAKPHEIEISLIRKDGTLVLSVEDDGQGIEQTASGSSGLGIGIMQHRASLIGATLTVLPRDTPGTVVRCVIPESVLTQTSVERSTNRQETPSATDSP